MRLGKQKLSTPLSPLRWKRNFTRDNVGKGGLFLPSLKMEKWSLSLFIFSLHIPLIQTFYKCLINVVSLPFLLVFFGFQKGEYNILEELWCIECLIKISPLWAYFHKYIEIVSRIAQNSLRKFFKSKLNQSWCFIKWHSPFKYIYIYNYI